MRAGVADGPGDVGELLATLAAITVVIWTVKPALASARIAGIVSAK
ncbi:MAG: hypothetical protein IPH03_03700 [Tetrasphaera sp.]|nr:hypothetical protein [Tetrasphaera sp.]